MKKSEIQIRDPFILAMQENSTYYLYGTTDQNAWQGPATGFDVFYSHDLEEWSGPFPVFRPPNGFWATENFWAPEVHQYQGRFFMFASFKASGVCRGTQILVSDSPMGPFVPHSPKAVTPVEWECLDGTLYVDPQQQPWLVFSHEWVQVGDGEIWALPLAKDLRQTADAPILLFRASQSGWAHQTNCGDPTERVRIYVTDGPFLHQTDNGQLLMLWSSFASEGYAIGIARSTSGSIQGPWIHDGTPLFSKDGGHGMVFRTFEGDLKLAIHAPNDTPNERPVFLSITENATRGW